MKTETLTWVLVTEELPDDDTTVLINSPHSSEPVWLGYCSDKIWFLIDGCETDKDAVKAWAHIPRGCK